MISSLSSQLVQIGLVRRVARWSRFSIAACGVLTMLAGCGGNSGHASPSPSAGFGSEAGNLRLNPATGASTSTPTWSTKTACPSGFQGSAVLYELNRNGSIGSQIGVGTQTAVTAPFGGSLAGNVASLISLGTNIPVGTPDEWVVACYASTTGTGTPSYTQSIFVTVASSHTYSTSASGPTP